MSKPMDDRLKILGKVEWIPDGDTLKMFDIFFRCRWMDAPEVRKRNETSNEDWVLNHWEWGRRSQKYLYELIKTNDSYITAYRVGVDQYDRIISDWYIGNQSVQKLMVEAGLCVPFLPQPMYEFKYQEEELYISIVSAVATAYRENRGFWGDYKSGRFILPFKFKKMIKSR